MISFPRLRSAAVLMQRIKRLRGKPHNGVMTTDEIRARIASLQEEINALAAMLPEHAHIAFGTVYVTKPTELAHRKRLVVAIKETQ
jgi:hypothetical protein